MVITLLFFLLSSFAQCETESGFTFRLEISQPSIFQGEQVTANFVLEAPNEKTVEIEVMKFPEFRGFWSENLLLRQGPIRLMALPGPKKKAMALVGSYSLSSIVGMKSPQIEPMKILIRSFGEPTTALSSEGKTPTFSELPPIPQKLKQFHFSGAVGHFSIMVNQTQIPYRKNQPFLIRAELQGEGNFPEVNALPLDLPQYLTLISQSNTPGSFSGNSKRKLFEWIISADQDSLQDWNPNPILAFNPSSRSYEPLVFPSLHFVLLPETAMPQNILRLSSVSFLPKESWTKRTMWGSSFWFWLIQVLGGLTIFGRVFFVQMREIRKKWRSDPFFNKKVKMKEASSALKKQNWEQFLLIAAQISRQLITESPSPSLLISLNTLIEADNQLRFSPQKTLSIPTETLKSHWENLCDNLKQHPKPDRK